VKKRSKGLLRLAEETKLTAACAKLEAAQAELLAAVTKIADSGAPLNTDQAATYLQVSPGTLAVWPAWAEIEDRDSSSPGLCPDM